MRTTECKQNCFKSTLLEVLKHYFTSGNYCIKGANLEAFLKLVIVVLAINDKEDYQQIQYSQLGN